MFICLIKSVALVFHIDVDVFEFSLCFGIRRWQHSVGAMEIVRVCGAGDSVLAVAGSSIKSAAARK